MLAEDHRRRVVLVVAWLALVSSAWQRSPGQFRPAWSVEFSPAEVPTVDSQTEGDLVQVKELIQTEQWEEAVELLRRLVEAESRGVVPVLPGRRDRFVSLREYGHRQIANLPAEALDLYRRRVDPLAEQWYAAGKDRRDRQLLERLVDEMFCSSWSDDALMALGELALQRGEYEAARIYWERISPLARGPLGRPMWLMLCDVDLEANWEELYRLRRPEEQLWLAYPGSQISLADVLARLVLVSIHERSFRRAEVELAALDELFPDAQGRLGGRTVAYGRRLRELLTEARDWPVAAPSPDWTTFAGGFRRTRQRRPAPVVAGMAWDEPIALPKQPPADVQLAAFGFPGRRIAEDRDTPLSYHPLVVGDLLLFCDNEKIYAFDRTTGKPVAGEDGVVHQLSEPVPRRLLTGTRRAGSRRFTMTAHDGKLLARLGETVVDRATGVGARSRERLIGKALDRKGWLTLFDIKLQDTAWRFEGAPVSDGENLYVALRHLDVVPQTYLASYDTHSGRLRWRTKICSASSFLPRGVEQVTNNLVTLAEDTLYYNTNLGVIAAVAASDGSIRWLTRYDRSSEQDPTQRAAFLSRDLTPCVYYQGIVIAAPADTPNIYAFDAATGALHWKCDIAVDAVHLLGVAGGNLIASGDRLWWIDVDWGRVAAGPWPESRHAGVRGYGRGSIAGERVYWPTQGGEVLVFDVAPPRDPPVQPRERIELSRYGASSGNLVIAGDSLIIAAAQKMYALTPRLPQRKAPVRTAQAGAASDKPAAPAEASTQQQPGADEGGTLAVGPAGSRSDAP